MRSSKIIGVGGCISAVIAATITIASAGAQSSPPTADTLAAPASPTATSGAAPLPAFAREATAADALPEVLSQALAQLGKAADITRKVASVDGTDVYVSLVDPSGAGICLQLWDVADSVGYSTCNAREGVSRGWLYIGTPTSVVGLVDPSVSRVDVPGNGGARAKPITPAEGVYVVPRSLAAAEASLLRADGSLAGMVPVGPPPGLTGAGTGG